MSEHAPEPNPIPDEELQVRSLLPSWITETPYWAISAVVHLILLLLLAGVILLERQAETEDPTIVRALVESKPPPDLRPELRRRDKRNLQNIENVDPELVVPEIEVEVTELAKGDPQEHINRQLLQHKTSNSFGLLGDPGGQRHGWEDAKGRFNRPQAPIRSESAVLLALDWLRRHQHPDGHWACRDFVTACRDPGKPCSNQHPSYTDGRGAHEHDVGVTALALLAYTGFGHTHRFGEFREFRPVVKRAMDWLLAQQVRSKDLRTDGRIGPADGEQWIYGHAIATMALAELLAMGRDFRLRKPVEKAVRLCLVYQNPGYGWRYGFREGSDTSVTGWMVLALKTARACSQMRLLKIRKEEFTPAFEGALTWFRGCTARSGRTGYLAPGDPGSQLTDAYPDPYPYSKKLSCMTAVSVLCRLFAGESRREPDIQRGVKILLGSLPRWRPATGKRKSTINMYYWYYASYALYQYGKSPWKQWSPAMLDALCDNQRLGGCEDGSWDPIGEWGAVGGRVYATALTAMTLEVYYRYQRAQETPAALGSRR